MSESPQLGADGRTFPPVTPDPPYPPGSDVGEVVDDMSASAVADAEAAEPPPDTDAVAPEGDAQHEPAD